MGDTKIRSGRSAAVEVAAGVGLSTAFLSLAVVVSPVAAAAIVIPVSLAAGVWRAHTQPRQTPHSLSAPVFPSSAVIHATRVTVAGGGQGVMVAGGGQEFTVAGGDHGVTTAA